MWIYTRLLSPKPLRRLANRILVSMIPETLPIPEGTLHLNRKDAVVSGALVLGAYEVRFAETFREKATGADLVVDIGANLGYYTLIAAKRAKRVIAFEPERENVALLRRTLETNLATNVTVIEKGLGEKKGSLPLHVHPDNKGKHTLAPLEEAGVTDVEVPISTLDEELELIGNPRVDLIKIDIEGWEAKALRGAARTIARDRPAILFEFAPHRIERAGDDPMRMLGALEKEGYELLSIDEETGTPLPADGNALYASLRAPDDYVNLLARPGS